MGQVIALGEVMGRLKTPGALRFGQAAPGPLELTFAGAEVNAAVTLAQLGHAVQFVTALPDQPLAEACLGELQRLGVGTRHVLRTAEGRLGLFFLEAGINQRPGQVIYDRDYSALAITPPDQYRWEDIFAEADWLLISGITPAVSRNAADVTRAAIQAARERGVRIALDMNFRSKLWRWNPELSPRELAGHTLRSLLPEVSLLIGGREDFQMLLTDPRDQEQAATAPLSALSARLAEVYPQLQWIAMSRRENLSAQHNRWGGFLYEVATEHSFEAPEQDGWYEIPAIVDRLGTGDAFTGGLLAALQEPDASPQQVLRFATAVGCLAHSIEGDYCYLNRAEVLALLAGEQSGRIQR